ncbi:hypothetical protein SDJN02_23783 [Cucurbita argyrosperma subsp. argyrosperma]|nr:hypothetical protein SDJN02_23783 [Cucurbita argyrosperma subsp. argyrosperma]
MKFLGWYVKIGTVSALIGASMEMFMIKTGFCIEEILLFNECPLTLDFSCSRPRNDKVTVLESEKIAWENSPEAQAIREALNPWRNHDAAEEARKDT